MPPADHLKKEIRYHAQRFSFHKLNQTSRFLSELLLSITNKPAGSFNPQFLDSNTDSKSRFNLTWAEPVSINSDSFILARTLFETRELKRCAFVLKPFESNPECLSSLFLYNYSLYMYGYQRKEEEIFERHKAKQYAGTKVIESSIINCQVHTIRSNLERLYEQNTLDDMNTYLYGLVLVEIGNHEEAAQAFLKALNLNPCFWGAWQELARLSVQEKLKSDLVEITSCRWICYRV